MYTPGLLGSSVYAHADRVDRPHNTEPGLRPTGTETSRNGAPELRLFEHHYLAHRSHVSEPVKPFIDLLKW
jgi:hypothetical protein